MSSPPVLHELTCAMGVSSSYFNGILDAPGDDTRPSALVSLQSKETQNPHLVSAYQNPVAFSSMSSLALVTLNSGIKSAEVLPRRKVG